MIILYCSHLPDRLFWSRNDQLTEAVQLTPQCSRTIGNLSTHKHISVTFGGVWMGVCIPHILEWEVLYPHFSEKVVVTPSAYTSCLKPWSFKCFSTSTSPNSPDHQCLWCLHLSALSACS